MEIRDLRYFIALADHESFTRAALALGIAQPSLSQQIRKLERDLGTPLFHRTKRAVTLTAAGRSILDEARTVLAQVGALGETVRLATSGEQGELRIGFIEAAVFGLLPRLVRTFRSAYPRVKLSLIELTTVDQVVGLRQRQIDVGILRTPIAEDVETMPILKEVVSVALPATHPLAARSRIPLAALKGEQFIFHSGTKATRLRDQMVGLFRQLNCEPQIVQEAGEFHTICGLVAAGLGVAFVPASASALHIPGVSYRKLISPEITIDYRAGWLRGAHSPTLRAFASALSRLRSETPQSQPSSLG